MRLKFKRKSCTRCIRRKSAAPENKSQVCFDCGKEEERGRQKAWREQVAEFKNELVGKSFKIEKITQRQEVYKEFSEVILIDETTKDEIILTGRNGGEIIIRERKLSDRIIRELKGKRG